MAGEVVDMGPEAEAWLPSDFLEKDWCFSREQEKKKSGCGFSSPVAFPWEFPYDCLSSFSDSSSNLSSPVDSTTESESQSDDDLDEYLAGLTTQMADYFLLEADDDAADQKSLLGSSSASGDKPSLVTAFLTEQEFSKPLCRVPNPLPSPEPPSKDDTVLDALYSMTGQREYTGSVVFGFPVALAQAFEDGGFTRSDGCAGVGNYYSSYRKPPLTRQQLQQLKQQQLVNQKLAGAAAWGGRRNGVPSPVGMASSAWPVVCVGKSQHGVGVIRRSQPPPATRSGLRGVFLPGGLGQKPSTGTGVFLPRRAGSPAQMCRRGTACSTVLVRDRAVHALNLEGDVAGAAAVVDTGPAGHCGGVVVGGVPPRRPAQLHGGGCFVVGAAGAGAVSCYSSLTDGGGGGRGCSVNYNNINKKRNDRGGEMVDVGLRIGRGFPLALAVAGGPQEEQQRPKMKLQQQQKPLSVTAPTTILSPETQLPPEWTY